MFNLRKVHVLIFSTITLVVVLFFAICLYRTLYEPILVEDEPALIIELPAGRGMHYLLQVLQEKKIVRHPLTWRLFALLYVDTRHLQAGEYAIKAGTTFQQFLKQVARGDVVLHPFTIVEGWTYHRLLETLKKNKFLKHVTDGLSDQQLLEQLGSQQDSPEGLFFPDTYYYTLGDSDFSILQQSYQKMQTLLQHAWDHRAVRVSYQGIYDALIVASLIEKETAEEAEKPLVAAVILNRLKQGMRLQIDPTVLYGLGARQGRKPTHADLNIPTPYNTYQHFGLPPTPIALPGESSIKAALHPAPVDYLYFVARGQGGHQFSENYDKHLQAVKALIQQKNHVHPEIADFGGNDVFLNQLDGEPLCRIKQAISFR